MAFIAVRRGKDNRNETLGVARAVSDPDNFVAEIAIVVRSDFKGKGLGSVLLNKLIDYCRERGTKQIVGRVLPSNQRMLSLAEKSRFQLTQLPDDEAMEVRLTLHCAIAAHSFVFRIAGSG